MNIETNKLRQGQSTSLTRRRALAMLGICLLCLPALAGLNEQKPTADVAQYDKTIGDTRVVLLAISSVNILAPRSSESNETNTTYIEMSFLTEYVGTNSFAALALGSIDLYLQNSESKPSPLIANAVLNLNTVGSLDKELPPMDIKVANDKKCYIRHVFLHIPDYPSGARVTCVLKAGFYGSLANFEFDGILLPRSFGNN